MVNDKSILIVKAIILYKSNIDNPYFLELTRAQTRKYPNKGDLPGGKIEKDESPSNAIIREVKEETGLIVLEQIHFLTAYYFLLDDQKYKEYLFCFFGAYTRNNY